MYLPTYSPDASSASAPSSSSTPRELLPPYTQRPNAFEETIEFSRSPGSSSLGSFVKRTKGATIVLYSQEEGASRPVYGAHGDICGQITPQRNETVVGIDLKLEGSISTMSAAGGRIVPILRQTHSLYKKPRPARSSTSPLECASMIPFNIRMPLRFRSSELARDPHLPPTLRVSSKQGLSDILYADVEYSLVVSIEQHVSVLGMKVAKSVETVRISFTYLPRTRPTSPAIDRPLQTSLKCQPNEWSQIASRIESLDAAMGALELDLFTPSIRVYPIGASIRFHLHAYGTLAAVRELHRLITEWHDGWAPVPMRITLMRQWAISPSESAKKTVHHVELCEATSRPLPPSIDSETTVPGTATLDWDGEIPLDPGLLASESFDAGHLLAEDYVAVSFQPAPSSNSKLSPHAFYYPIRLVSDPWIPTSDYDDDHEFLFLR